MRFLVLPCQAGIGNLEGRARTTYAYECDTHPEVSDFLLQATNLQERRVLQSLNLLLKLLAPLQVMIVASHLVLLFRDTNKLSQSECSDESQGWKFGLNGSIAASKRCLVCNLIQRVIGTLAVASSSGVDRPQANSTNQHNSYQNNLVLRAGTKSNNGCIG